jgi:hypothetical protein
VACGRSETELFVGLGFPKNPLNPEKRFFFPVETSDIPDVDALESLFDFGLGTAELLPKNDLFLSCVAMGDGWGVIKRSVLEPG